MEINLQVAILRTKGKGKGSIAATSNLLYIHHVLSTNPKAWWYRLFQILYNLEDTLALKHVQRRSITTIPNNTIQSVLPTKAFPILKPTVSELGAIIKFPLSDM